MQEKEGFMKYKDQIIRLIIPGIIGLSLMLSGCAAKKHAWGDLKTGLNLKYSIAPDQVLNYRNSSETQTLEMMEQSMKSSIINSFDYSIRGTGTDEQNNLLTEITINDFSISSSTVQGKFTPDTSALKGKSFNVTFSPTGKELLFTGVDELPQISIGQMGGEGQSVEHYFMDILPDLADNPIKVGESWISQRDSRLQAGPLEISVKAESTSILEGLETVDRMKCARVKTLEKNVLVGSGDMMGNKIKLKGEINTTSIWYFAYKKGIFVRASVDQVSDIKIDMGAMGEIPQTAETKMKIELVR